MMNDLLAAEAARVLWLGTSWYVHDPDGGAGVGAGLGVGVGAGVGAGLGVGVGAGFGVGVGAGVGVDGGVAPVCVSEKALPAIVSVAWRDAVDVLADAV